MGTEMTDAETAAHIRQFVEERHGEFSWPTDMCGYDQHIKFVRHRNDNWQTYDGTFKQFVLDYAASLEV